MTTFDFQEMEGAFMFHDDRRLIKEYTALAASHFDPCTVLHIGVEMGASVYCSRAGAPGAAIFGVDVIGEDRLGGTLEQQDELDLIMIRGDSREVWKSFVADIHFLFIDGDHTLPVVSADARNWIPKVLVGGIVGFHDALQVDWAPFVTQAIDEWLAQCDVVEETSVGIVLSGETRPAWVELPHSELSRFFRRVR